MIFIKPFFVERVFDKKNNTGVGEHYLCYCPYCGEKNLTWPSEYNIKDINGTNKCKHFTKLTKNGKLLFKSKPTIKIKNDMVYIDDVNIQIKLNDLICYIQDLLDRSEYEIVNIPTFLYKSMCVSTSYAFGAEFKMDRVLMIMDGLNTFYKKLNKIN